MQEMANGVGATQTGNARKTEASKKAQHSGCSRVRWTSFLLAVALSCYVSNIHAQVEGLTKAVSVSSSAPPTFSRDVQEVGVVLTVTNWFGHFVKGLSEADLRILDNNQPVQKITYFQSQTNLPLKVGIVVDASASIAGRFRFEMRSAGAFLHRVLRQDRDAGVIVGFNQKVELYQTLSSHEDFLSRIMASLRPGGDTAIYDAVAFTCRELAKVDDDQPTRRALILLTDGDDNSSEISLQQAIESALRSNTIVYVLSTNPDYSLSLGEPGELAMKQLAEATGGRLLRADNNDDVSRAFSKISRELRNQYAIGYKPPSGHPDGLFHRLQIQGPKSLHIYYRLGYFAVR
jgi:Ca-activated chloride channel family protein